MWNDYSYTIYQNVPFNSVNQLFTFFLVNFIQGIVLFKQ